MKKTRFMITAIGIFVIIGTLMACGSAGAQSGEKGVGNKERVYEASNTIDVFAALSPNEGGMSNCHTFGKDSVTGHDIHKRITTDSTDIYVDFKINILELHPKIMADLLSFVHQEMLTGYFVNEGDTIVPFDMYELSAKGMSQEDLVRKFLDWEGKLFDKELPTIMEYGSGYSGFNMEMDIEPVFLNDRYVTYKKYAYKCTGGAHGNDTRFLRTYDRNTGEPVDLKDFIEPSKMDKVRELVAMHMADKYPIYSSVNSVHAYLDSLNRWRGLPDINDGSELDAETECERITLQNYPVNDPGVHEAGLVFTYEKYHLTPGVCGCPAVVLTFDEIRDCLKPPFSQYTTDSSKLKRITN